ncbi:imidazole glycerol phosphate synthase subunit HisH [Vibrio tubiashii]|uniref:imidazole glycerol phosphate synthase subunit HisH n=1 Tax=Vibrio tubiashii TaxID=29498 RepID=UPI001EFED520|nr:imidazole glycerol phosphate synthase subunit HisH [Vibrio tubiashii]MCG9579481.1 imidazole glycerol phosphate synthase subunit HisH [Vibrio tubiashii]
MKVNILDIGSGNISSIQFWLENSNIGSQVINDPNGINSDLLILPGVGSAGSYMKRLTDGRFDQAILEHLDKGGRLLGICLGFQIMSNWSEEDGGVKGLGIISGRVERLPHNMSHNSWEAINFNKTKLLGQSLNNKMNYSRKRILNGRVFYNHEYGFVNDDKEAFTVPVSKQLEQYSGFLVKDNIIGIQFHPEKSQRTGAELISMII